MSGFINYDLIDRVDWIVDEDVLLHDDTFKIHDKDEQEARHLSELYRIADNMTKKELAVMAGVAAEKYPFMVMQVIAEYLIRHRENR